MSKTYEFQTEITQLLDLMIHSLYSEREIFLRELIANASDACDKRRFESLTDNTLLTDDQTLSVFIDFDKEANSLTIKDNGIGMSQEDIIDNIGTIARSGTKKFIQSIKESKSSDENSDTAPQLIGQFGVGFYSAFMVADKVELTSRKAGTEADTATKWISDGKGSYTLETVTQDEVGTQITLFLRDDCTEFTEHYRLSSIIKKYSEHLSLPIHLPTLDEEGNKSSDENASWEVVNDGVAIWSKPKREVSEEEYTNFYKTLHYDMEAPAITLHNKVEGTMEYTSLFFIPSKAPFDIYDRERKHGIKLYIRKMFIMDDTDNILPTYLRFARGVVDAIDLPLNVSREFLQNNKEIAKIKSSSTKKILNEFKKIAENDTDKYQLLWNEYGKVLKEGIIEDMDNKETLTNLLRFATTQNNSDKQNTSLAQYVESMGENQKSIYYITADSYQSALHSPHLETFKKHNINVLLLSDPVDEWLINHIGEFNEKPLKSAAKANDLDDLIDTEEQKEKQADQEKTLADLMEKIKTSLDGKIKDVRISSRLTDSPVCLVADEHDMGGNMERILKSMGQDMPQSQPILEINPDHKIINHLNSNTDKVDEWAEILFNQALLSEGAPIENPALYVQKINNLLSQAI